MKILTRYLCKEFFTFFLIALIAFLVLYTVIDFFGKIDNFMEAGVPMKTTLRFFLYQLPLVIQQMLPISMLISIMLVFGLMNKRNEILALKGSGLNSFNLSYPLIGISVLIGVVSFFLSESIVPITSPKANEIWNFRVEKRDAKGAYKLSHIWYRGDRSIYQIRAFDSKKNIMEGLTISFFDENFNLIKRIDAEKATWGGDRWSLAHGLIQTIDPDGSWKSVRFERHTIQLPENPNNFKHSMKAPEDMSFWELRDYARKIRKEGFDSTKAQVDLNTKLAFPFISLTLTLVGIPLALRSKRGGIPFNITIGIGISFLYLLTFGLSRSLAISGALPPLLGAWMANLLFLFLGIYLTLAEQS